jgi:hypothetical protein
MKNSKLVKECPLTRVAPLSNCHVSYNTQHRGVTAFSRAWYFHGQEHIIKIFPSFRSLSTLNVKRAFVWSSQLPPLG